MPSRSVQPHMSGWWWSITEHFRFPLNDLYRLKLTVPCLLSKSNSLISGIFFLVKPDDLMCLSWGIPGLRQPIYTAPCLQKENPKTAGRWLGCAGRMIPPWCLGRSLEAGSDHDNNTVYFRGVWGSSRCRPLNWHKKWGGSLDMAEVTLILEDVYSESGRVQKSSRLPSLNQP